MRAAVVDWIISIHSSPPPPSLHIHAVCHMTLQSCPLTLGSTGWLALDDGMVADWHRQGYEVYLSSYIAAIATQRAPPDSYCLLELSLRINSHEKYLSKEPSLHMVQLTGDPLKPAQPTSVDPQLSQPKAQLPPTCRSLRLNYCYSKPLGLGVVCYTATLWQQLTDTGDSAGMVSVQIWSYGI